MALYKRNMYYNEGRSSDVYLVMLCQNVSRQLRGFTTLVSHLLLSRIRPLLVSRYWYVLSCSLPSERPCTNPAFVVLPPDTLRLSQMTSERLTQLDVTKLTEAVGRVEGGMHRVEGGIGRVEGGMNRVEGGMEQVDQGVERVEGRMDRVEEGIGLVEGGMERVEGGVERVGRGIERVEGGVERLDQGVGRVEEGIGRVEEGVGRVEEDLQKVDREIQAIARDAQKSLLLLKNLQGPGYPYPHLVAVKEIQAEGRRTLWSRLRGMFVVDMTLHFLCPMDRNKVPCGPGGNGYRLRKTRGWVRTISPALQV